MAYKIICYGDSNTYGACGFVGGRHHADIRWTGILQNSGLYDVVNLGENGREIPSDQWELNELTEILRREGDFDLLTVMLGTNDLLTMVRSGSAKVAVRMEQFLTEFLQVQPMVCRPGTGAFNCCRRLRLLVRWRRHPPVWMRLVVSLGIIMRILQRNFIFILLMHLSGLSNWGLTGYI